MAGDYGRFKFGNTEFPLISSTANSLLQDADPAIFYALDYCKSMLILHLQDRWNAAVYQAGMSNMDGYGSVVNYTLPYDPMPFLQTQQTKFPLLALWEKESVTEQKTFSWYHANKVWQLLYCLPALTAAQMEQLYPALKAADAILRDRIEQGYDPNYHSGREIWSFMYAGVEKIQLSKSVFGYFTPPDKTNLYLPTLLCTIDLSVREGFNPAFLETLDGIDITQTLDGYTFLENQINL